MTKCNKKNGFTLAETMIVLAILGAVSLIVIPQIVHKFNETSARMKIKKAMSVYDHSFAKMILEQGSKSGNELSAWVKNVDCNVFVDYFKTINKKSENDSCTFKTQDGLWWDISNVAEPIIATSPKALEAAKKNNKTDGKTSFKFEASYDKYIGSFRINDISFEKKRLYNKNRVPNDDKTPVIQNKVDELEKVYDFIAKPSEGSVQYIGNDFFYNKYGENNNYVYDDEGRVESYSTHPIVLKRCMCKQWTGSEFKFSYNDDNSYSVEESKSWGYGPTDDIPKSDITVENYDKNGNKINSVHTYEAIQKEVTYRIEYDGEEERRYPEVVSEKYVKTVTNYDANDNIISQIKYDENGNIIE